MGATESTPERPTTLSINEKGGWLYYRHDIDLLVPLHAIANIQIYYHLNRRDACIVFRLKSHGLQERDVWNDGRVYRRSANQTIIDSFEIPYMPIAEARALLERLIGKPTEIYSSTPPAALTAPATVYAEPAVLTPALDGDRAIMPMFDDTK